MLLSNRGSLLIGGGNKNEIETLGVVHSGVPIKLILPRVAALNCSRNYRDVLAT